MLSALLLLPGLALAAECPGLDDRIAAVDASTTSLTMPLLQAWWAARDQGQEACLAEALDARGLPSWAPPRVFPAEEGTRAPDKGLRDLFHLPNHAENEDFVVWWGESGGVSQGDIDDLLDAFDDAWSREIDEYGLEEPYGTSQYKFNVFIGDTGSGAPSAYGNSGYYTVDSQGYPMIVVAAGALDDMDWGRGTAVHEFFHAVQHATGAYQTDTGAWLWEACAVWVEGEIYPDNPYYAAFLFGFAFMPHLSLDLFDYPDSGAIEEYHQYGAFIFMRYLSEVASGWELVRDLWSQGGSYDDPLEVLDEALQAQGGDLTTTWADFLAHDAIWDYQDGETYAYYLDWYAGYYDDYGVVETLVNGGSEEWREPTTRLPQRYGAQYVQLRYPSAGTLHVEVEGDPQGSAGDAATWVGTVVFDSTPAEYVPLTFDGGNARLSMEDADRALNVWLVLGVTTPARRSGETFGYRYRVWVEPEAPVDTGTPADTGEGGDEPPGGCGCVSGGGLVAWPVLLGLVGLAARRRR
ncbi:MAG: DUF6055 domain-containing protein [Pseudomonadota bacterium]